MIRKARITACVSVLMLVMPVGAVAQNTDLFGFPLPSGEELDALIAEAQLHPLGSEENPVRAARPEGQRAYLDRLRCSNGRRPSYQRIGSSGIGAFGRIIDGYRVTCNRGEPAESIIYMDMYRPGYAEPNAVEGFTIVKG